MQLSGEGTAPARPVDFNHIKNVRGRMETQIQISDDQHQAGRATPPRYNFDCGHQADHYIMTTTTRRSCPICNKGRAVSVNKTCAVCGLQVTLPMKSNRAKYCPDCRPQVARALSRVNKKNRVGYTPASEIDFSEVIEDSDNPDHDPLDIIFAKYADDPFYRPPATRGTARPRGGSNGQVPPPSSRCCPEAAYQVSGPNQRRTTCG